MPYTTLYTIFCHITTFFFFFFLYFINLEKIVDRMGCIICSITMMSISSHAHYPCCMGI